MKNKTENKTETILLQKDIDAIRNSAIIMATERDKQMTIKALYRNKGVEYITLSNGYMTSMIIDATKKDKFRYLLSTHNPSGVTDLEISEIIAKKVLGDGYVLLDKKPGNFIDFKKEEEKKIEQNINLTQEDIKKARESMVVLTKDKIEGMLKSGGMRPVILSNWYKVTISSDVLRENTRIIHLTVSNTIGKTDAKIAENMARDIIGEGFGTLGPMLYPNAIHFMKIENPYTMVELFSNIGDEDKKDEKIKKEGEGRGERKAEEENIEGKNIKAVNEGEVNDGIEGRVKKKI